MPLGPQTTSQKLAVEAYFTSQPQTNSNIALLSPSLAIDARVSFNDYS
jgi:hypothetical protein